MKTAEDIVKDNSREIVSVSYDQTAREACGVMVKHKIGAVVVKKDDRYVGIWSERDLLRSMNVEGFDPQTARVGDHMSTPIRTVPWDTSLTRLQDMFLGLFVRHLLVENDDETIGIISIGDVLRAILLEKEQRVEELTSFCSLEYYENWKFGRKKKK